MSELSVTEHNKFHFTTRELECLTAMTTAKSLEKSTQKLALSPKTIYFYLLNIQHKINCLIKSVKP